MRISSQNGLITIRGFDFPNLAERSSTHAESCHKQVDNIQIFTLKYSYILTFSFISITLLLVLPILRVDTTAVKTCIHYPTDSSLLSDRVRVLTRIVKKAKATGLASGKVVHDVSRAMKRRVLNIVKFVRGRMKLPKTRLKNRIRES